MKFDVFNWSEIPVGKDVQSPEGFLRLRLSQPGAVYLTCEGVEALAGYGASFDLELPQAVTFNVTAPAGTRVFMEEPPDTWYEPEGEVFTNQDRRPHESGQMQEVKRALREMELRHRAQLREMAAARPAPVEIQQARKEADEAEIKALQDPPADE